MKRYPLKIGLVSTYDGLSSDSPLISWHQEFKAFLA